MKVLKIFLILSAVITISYFSWSYYAGKILPEKHERATLVYGEYCDSMKLSYLERLSCV